MQQGSSQGEGGRARTGQERIEGARGRLAVSSAQAGCVRAASRGRPLTWAPASSAARSPGLQHEEWQQGCGQVGGGVAGDSAPQGERASAGAGVAGRARSRPCLDVRPGATHTRPPTCCRRTAAGARGPAGKAGPAHPGAFGTLPHQPDNGHAAAGGTQLRAALPALAGSSHLPRAPPGTTPLSLLPPTLLGTMSRTRWKPVEPAPPACGEEGKARAAIVGKGALAARGRCVRRARCPGVRTGRGRSLACTLR